MLSLVVEKRVRAQPMLLNAHVPECPFLSCGKTLGSPSLVGYRLPVYLLARVRCPLFYIPSPSDVGIVFLLSFTTSSLVPTTPRSYFIEEHSAPEIV